MEWLGQRRKGSPEVETTFADNAYRLLRDDPDAKTSFAENIVRAYRRVMRIIDDAKDERDIRVMKSLRFKRLEGKRQHQHSLRLNDQWRLIVEIVEGDPKNTIHVIRIEDYH
jgi:proteic killer suppression protein